MASGDTLVIFGAQAGVPTGTVYATQDVRAGGSTPAESVPVLDFDASQSEYIDFHGVMPQGYAGTTGVKVRITWGASSGTSGNVRWEAAFRSIEDDAEDVDAAHSYDYNGVSDVAPSASGEFTTAEISFTDGADMDNVGPGDPFILRIYRDHDHVDDTMTGDAELLHVEIRET